MHTHRESVDNVTSHNAKRGWLHCVVHVLCCALVLCLWGQYRLSTTNRVDNTHNDRDVVCVFSRQWIVMIQYTLLSTTIERMAEVSRVEVESYLLNYQEPRQIDIYLVFPSSLLYVYMRDRVLLYYYSRIVQYRYMMSVVWCCRLCSCCCRVVSCRVIPFWWHVLSCPVNFLILDQGCQRWLL